MGLNKRLIDQAGGAAGVVNTDNFAPVTYTGNGSTQSISSLDFQPDFVWVKKRSGGTARDHMVYDSIRGAGYRLRTNQTLAESYASNELTSFDTNGFSLGDDDAVNGSTYPYVAWCWKAGGAAVSNTDGTITSTVSANQDAGFSIVKWAGSDANDTVGHGLSSPPEMIIIKNLDQSTGKWAVYNHTLGNGKTLYLNETAAEETNTFWQNTSPTDSVFYVSGQDTVNGPQGDIIAYCFHSVDGYQKVGSYTGNGSATGPTITLGFRPRFVMIKQTNGTGAWLIIDSVRSPSNPRQLLLQPQSSEQELNVGDAMDFNSDGFTLTDTNASRNASGGEYIYLAIA